MLPAATSLDSENVYALNLVFSDGTVREAMLGLVASYGASGEAATRVIAPIATPTWARVGRVSVIPCPGGIQSFTINGVETDPGLGGDAGWYAAVLGGGNSATLALVDTDSETFSATLERPFDGTTLFVR